MSAASRPVQATPGMGQLVAIFAALLAGTALIVALAYGQLTASQAGAPAAAAAPAPVVHDHGWSSSSVSTAPAVHDHGWSETTPVRPSVRGNAFDKAHAPGGLQREQDSGGSIRVTFPR